MKSLKLKVWSVPEQGVWDIIKKQCRGTHQDSVRNRVWDRVKNPVLRARPIKDMIVDQLREESKI